MLRFVTGTQMSVRWCVCLAVWTFRLGAVDAPNQLTSAGRPVDQTTDYVPPAVLTADIFALDGTAQGPLFRFKRVASSSGHELKVSGEFSYPDGRTAARERVLYQDNHLVRYELDDLQRGGKGSATIIRDPAKPGGGKILFEYTTDPKRAPQTQSEPLLPNTLVNDMVGRFLAAHWDSLARGQKVACRCIVVPRQRTVGFTFRKEAETVWKGHDALELKMEPSSWLVSLVVDPLHFVVEKNPPHRVLQYTGRTTPKLGRPGHWIDLDAVTVFNW